MEKYRISTDQSCWVLNPEEMYQKIVAELGLIQSSNTFIMESSSILETVRVQAVEYLKRFSYEDLKSFTNDFDNKIGSGGFGVVYKGEFPNGMQVAVKVLNEQYVADDLFMDEVRIMGITYHHSLVKFLGYCSDANYKGLVYEYMENGSLDQILHKKDRGIEWDKLYDIMIDIANGISYLHDKRIIHHDVKPSNILLDSDFSPKVADFGLAKLIKRDVTHVTVTQAKGTRGYIAPEMWTPISQVTHKCDVYSFGMMLFDVLGRHNINQNEKSFLEIVWEGFEKGQLVKIIEDCGIETKHRERATILSMVALWCMQYTPKTRPEMSKVVKMLKQEIQVMTPPNPLLPSPDYSSQSSREVPEDEVSDKEIVDKILTQPENEDLEAIESQNMPSVTPESSNNFAFRSLDERNNILIKYVVENHGFSDRIPVAAILTFKCYLKWYFEYDSKPLDLLIQMIGSAIQKQDDHVPYWLSNTSMLLFLVVCGFKIRDTSTFTSCFQRISGCFRPLHDANINQSISKIVQHVEVVSTDHPALAFKLEVAECVEKAYEIIRGKLKEDLSSSLSLCIQAPTTTSWRADWKAYVTSSGINTPTCHWQSIIRTLNILLRKLHDSFVPKLFTSKIFTQAFYHINVQLFNSILTDRECCTLSYGEYVKVGLRELDYWCDICKNYVGSSSAQLKHTRQAMNFLVTVDKSEISIDELTNSLCPGLNITQLYTICRVYWDKENYTHGVSSYFLETMRTLYEDNRKKNVSRPLLLEDSSHIPFSVDDIIRFLGKTDFSNVKLNVGIIKHPYFSFLKL